MTQTFSRLVRTGMILTCLCLSFRSSAHAESPAENSLAIDAATKMNCLEKLQSALGSDEFWPSMHAAEALTQAGRGQEVLNRLKGRLETETDLRQQCGLAREQVRAGDRTKVSVLKSVLANPDPYGHTHACESLYKVNELGDRKLLQAARNDPGSPITALMAAAALARHDDANAMLFIRKQLVEGAPESRRIAAWILGVLGSQQDLPALRQGLQAAQTPRDRAFFEHALALRGDVAGQQALLRNLHDSDPSVQADAAYMAGDCGLFAATVDLKKLLRNDNLDVSVRAAQGLLTLTRTSPKEKTTGSRKSAEFSEPPHVVLKLTPKEGNSRNSEGDFIKTRDGKLRFIYSYFGKGTGSDYDTAELHERISLDGGKTWSETDRTVVRPESGLNVMSVSLTRLANGEIALFYCAKVSHSDCRPEMRISKDEGETWGPPIKCITDEVDYYVLNNSRVIVLQGGRIVVPVCLHRTLAPKRNDWAGELMCYLSDDNGQTWRRSESVFKGFDPSGKRVTVQEPGVVELKDGRVMMVIRSSAGCQMLSFSEDGGETWSKAEMSEISSPVSPASIRRIPQTGDLLLVWNDHSHVPAALKTKRTPLTVAVSRDDGKTWEHRANLFDNPDGWYCYIAIHFEGDAIVLSHCAGIRTGNRGNGLAVTDITRFNLDWLYQN